MAFLGGTNRKEMEIIQIYVGVLKVDYIYSLLLVPYVRNNAILNAFLKLIFLLVNNIKLLYAA